MASLVSEAACPPAFVPATISSYLFPPSGLPVNVRHCDGCPNSSLSFGDTLVGLVSHISFTLVSEFELAVNSVLVVASCTDCKVLHDETFELFVQHHTPESSFSCLHKLLLLRAPVL